MNKPSREKNTALQAEAPREQRAVGRAGRTLVLNGGNAPGETARCWPWVGLAGVLVSAETV